MSWKDNVTVVLNQIRPSLQADGGDVELVKVDDDGTYEVGIQHDVG